MSLANKVTGPVIMGGVALIGAWSAAQTDWSLPAPFTDGASQDALQDAFDARVVIRDWSITAWGIALWLVFGQTSPGAVPGIEGWLFSDEEFLAQPGFETRLESAIARILSVQEQLASQDTPLVIALLPDKARIMADKLRSPRAPVVEARYDYVLTALRRSGIEVLDLRPVLAGAREDAPVYLKTDTHWTPHGARAVAEALAPQIIALTEASTTFVTEATFAEMREGDLMRYLPLGARAADFGFPPEPVEGFATAGGAAGGLGLFGDPPPAGVLVGTSYSADPLWHFDGWLKQATGVDFLNQAEQGGGPFPPMDVLLNAQGADSLAVVVWDVPERYLAQ
ncbi:MAG: hypothetical protein JJ894_17155 [Dinoroseobacter sp.]|nr:hypothetical protein [Dinoroseobacter sp.]